MWSYSRIVRLLKIVLPLAALAILSALFLFPDNRRLAGGLILASEEIFSLTDGLTVDNPRFTGATEAGEPFVVRAASATPDGPNPKLVKLNGIEGEIDLQNGVSVALTAAAGELKPKENFLSLTGGVRIETSDGAIVIADKAEADLSSGEVRTIGPITAENPQGRIEAGQFRARISLDRSESDHFWFEERVKIVYNPKEAG